ncbi:hypothetical protein KUTeg_007421 [Tegillarca granosa]|uniref:DUF3504 domain-containing protein n=1 Tax=Tegillarca granosa TaxID=220873 RepID=A0ABQ9FF71_TEGGR|nr:hypothetical protein KUTeg_007421 [Tegillarca granosa]
MDQKKVRCERPVDIRMYPIPNLTKLEVDESAIGADEEPEIVIRTATNQLKEYAASKGHSLHSITLMPPEQQSEYLKDFYTVVKGREDNGLGIPTSLSLKYIRTGLQRYFLKHSGVDIIKDRSFDEANSVFDVGLRAAPRRCHRLRIEFDDLKKIYLSSAMNLEQPDTLQNKVFFDVNLYVCNRGKDFLRVMSKSDFQVSLDPDGRRYVWLKFNSKFSFRELVGGIAESDTIVKGNQIGERMYERQGDPRCPVVSFLKYLTHLHPMTEAFWQRPKRNFVATDYVWYDNTPLGNSTLSKIMTRTCQTAGLYENYTNHAIKSSYIPFIENLCKEAITKVSCINDKKERSSPMPAGPLPPRLADLRDDSGTTETSSVGSEPPDTDDIDQAVGLRQAKMKVLEMVHGLEVKDIKSFVDWMKTFRVNYDSGGLVVLCSPVDQSSSFDSFDSDTSKTKMEDKDCTSTNNTNPNPKVENGNDKSIETKPVAPRPHPPLKKQISFEKDEPMPKPIRDISTSSSEKSIDDKNSDFGISIKQVEFYSLNDTHCSTQDINPIRVTVPSQDTVLISGLQDSVQLLVHNREGPPMVPEPMHSRVFYSHHEMDVAVVAALVSARNSFKSTNQTVVEKPENFSKLLDKYKPVKKRSLTDLTTNLKKEDYEMPSRKKFASLDVPDTGTPKIKLPTQNSLPAKTDKKY